MNGERHSQAARGIAFTVFGYRKTAIGCSLSVIPRKNYETDLDEIPNEVKDNMQIIAVSTIADVLKYALVK